VSSVAFKHVASISAAVALTLGAFSAQATILTYSGFACTSFPGFAIDRTCLNGDPFGVDYGDLPAVNVFHDSFNGRLGTATDGDGLYYTDGAGFGDLVDAVHGIVPGYFPIISLIPVLKDYNVTLVGFDLASSAQQASTRFRIYDYYQNLLLDSGVVSVAGAGGTRTSFNIGLSTGFLVPGFIEALRLELDNTDGTIALDNLRFTIALKPNSIPEPGTAMLFGLGLVGLLTSRKLPKGKS
jgi:hypothetical protein